MKKNSVSIPHKTLERFCLQALKRIKVNERVARYVVDGLVQTSLRGVDSHGLRLFPHYVKAVEAGRINPKPKFKFKKTAGATGLLDADHTFGHAAGMVGMEHAIRLAQKSGIGAVSVCNSTHFGAAAIYSLLAAKKNMIGLSFTHADSLLLTYGGKRPFFGTNPICFTAPCAGEDPLCLDMATSVVTWNKIKQCKEKGQKIPSGIGADKKGKATQNVGQVASLLPIGGYKGFGLSMMIEVFCSLLSSMPFGRDIVSMYKAPIHKKRHLGHFFVAINISDFVNINVFKRRCKQMMDEVRREPKIFRRGVIMVSGDPEKRC